MVDLAAIKSELLEAIEASDAEGKYTEAEIDRIHALIEDLIPHSPISRPVDEQKRVAGLWKSRFAQFGPKHTAGKPIAHETSFKLLTFNALPDIALRMLQIDQEINHLSMDYNNVQLIEAIDGSCQAQLVMFGKYAISPDQPKRYKVDFSSVALSNCSGQSDVDLRRAFGFEADQPLIVSFKPPALHSDVVYCDDDLRINYGSMGGVYVLERVGR